MRVETVELRHQARRTERLLSEGVELVALFLAERVAQALRRRRALGQRVEQFLHVAGILREEVAVFGHEPLEVLLGVLPAGMLVQQIVQILEHAVHALTVLVGGTFEGLLHPGEPLVEHLAAQQVTDLLVVLPGLRAAPVVVGELLHGLRGGGGQFLDPHLREPGVVVECACEGLAFLEDGPVEQLTHLAQRAVEVRPVQQLPPTPIRLRRKAVQPAHRAVTAAQQFPQRTSRRTAGQHVLADRGEGLTQIHRRGEGVAAVVGPVPRAPAHQEYTAAPSSSACLAIRRAR